MYQKALQWLQEQAETHGDKAELIRRTGAVKPTFYRALQGGAAPGADTFLRWLDNLGVRFSFPDEDSVASREVCFVDAATVSASQGVPPPVSEEYLAVPLVGEAGAGPGIISEERIESWVLVYRNHRSVMRRSNLLAVEIGKNQRSMVPTLHPGDIVLVDRNDWGQDGFHSPGNIFLVREPGQEGGAKVKRVSLSGNGKNAILIFYSDNVLENEPEPHNLDEYDHNIRSAIVGRIVWAWADLSRK